MIRKSVLSNYIKNLLILFFLPFLITIVSCGQDDGNEEQGKQNNTEITINKEDLEAAFEKRIEENQHLQPQRNEFINNMLESGLASRIENPTGQPYIYVTEPFYLLSNSEQASMMNVIWHYYVTEDRNVDVLTIYDDDTGNQIGAFGRKGLVISE